MIKHHDVDGNDDGDDVDDQWQIGPQTVGSWGPTVRP